MKDFPRIIFFGTPGFAAASLERIVSCGFPVVAVVSAPDKPAGRGLKEHESEVKVWARAHGIPVLQPPNMKDPVFLEQLSTYKPDLQIVIAFRMMPKEVWSLPALGTFNLHASLLPQYRGAAPINWAIINGETETGVTTFFLNEQIDAGKIILREKVSIGPDETAGELHDRLMETGSELVIRTIERIVSGNAGDTGQDPLAAGNALLKEAPKIYKTNCRINWDQDVQAVHNFIRGLSPCPGAWTLLKMPDGTQQTLKIFKTMPEAGSAVGIPGEILSDGKSYIKIGTKTGMINLTVLQLAGRKTMNTGDFLRGFGWIFSETHGI